MSRYTGPRIRISRRFGQDLGLKVNQQKVARRISFPPGQHGRRGQGRLSDYGRQSVEKQKIRYTYGVTERQLRRYMQEAQRHPNATGSECLRFLERRLDNVVYRFGFAPTRAAARQFVNHGHVSVNGKRLTIPSCRVDVGDVITLSQTIYETPEVKKLVADETHCPPPWMQKQAGVGTIRRLPDRGDIDVVADEHLVVEFYSR